ncbi:MAG: hypothetical protein OXL68_09180 [Paracoccaceae bacterium]|nr:hypothetical protein [Paracoccaceae bacterium]
MSETTANRSFAYRRLPGFVANARRLAGQGCRVSGYSVMNRAVFSTFLARFSVG